MMKKQVDSKPRTLRMKTGLKAGEHCWDAWHQLLPWDQATVDRFVECCRHDNQCLK